MVYVGGILVLLIFGVMLTNKVVSVDIKTGTSHAAITIIGVFIFTAVLFSVLLDTNWLSNPAVSNETTLFEIGNLLINQYLLVFELLGILLLIALIGAASIARRDS
jgi:NADH-quinone oxidoreductase subunit J